MELSFVNSYPKLGKEKEYSVKLLYKFFCNNLFLGHWELARACIDQLHQERSFIDKPAISSILFDVAEYPYDRSIGLNKLKSPHHLSWLCLSAARRLQGEEPVDQTCVDRLTKDIEFRLLLVEGCSNTDKDIVEELYAYHQVVTSASFLPEERGQGHDIPTFSMAILNYLKQILASNSLLGHSIISAITYKGPDFKKNNEILQSLYISTINTLLDSLSDPDGSDCHIKRNADTVYELLALFDPERYENYLLLRELFSRLVEMCSSGQLFIRKNAVFSVLIGRGSDYIVDEFCSLCHDLECRQILNVSRRMSHGLDLDDDQRCILGLSDVKNSSQRCEMMLMFCLRKQRHLLETILETGLNLIKVGHFAELSRFTCPSELQPLKPLLLLLGWQYCYGLPEARQLLETLWDDQIFCHHPALSDGCKKLAYQMDLIQWCLDRTKPLLEASGTTTTCQKRAAEIFQGLETHSVLYVLHRATKLSSIDQQEVLTLLQKSPVAPESDNQKSKKRKTVRFTVYGENSVPLEIRDVISLEQQRDIFIYSGYCALKNVMDAIYFCVEYAQHELMNPVKTNDSRRNNRGSSCNSMSENQRSSGSDASDFLFSSSDLFPSCLSTEECNFSELYAKYVTAKLGDAKDYLFKLQPLTYRLEILENIFSLLFVTHESIQHSSCLVDSDSGDEGSFHTSRSTSTEVLQQSFVSQDSISPKTDVKSPMFNSIDDNVFASQFERSQASSAAYDEPFVDSPKLSDLRRNSPTVGLRESVSNETGIAPGMMRERRKVGSSPTGLKSSKVFSEHKDGSENASSGSLSSLFNLSKVGFLVSEYVVRDILAMLKDCLIDLTAARFQLHGSGSSADSFRGTHLQTGATKFEIDTELEGHLCHLVKCSVENDTLQKRLATLTQHIHEAQWRLQLVCHESIPRHPGEVLTEPVIESNNLEVEVDLRALAGLNHYRQRRYSIGRHSSMSMNLSENDTNDTQPSDGRRRKNSGARQSHSLRRELLGSHHSAGIIPFMLSPPDTLLSMTIRKGNVAQALQVIKLFKLEDRPEAKEVAFCQAYCKASKRLQNLSRTGSLGSSTSGSNPGKLSMKSLGSIAAVGMATVSVSNITDELLSSECLPVIPMLKHNVYVPQQVVQTLCLDNCPAMILFDLTCASCKTWDLCSNVMDSIKIRRPQKTVTTSTVSFKSSSADNSKLSDGKKIKTDMKVRGFWDFLDQMEKLLHVSAEEKSSRSSISLGVDTRADRSTQSLQQYFQCCTLPLSAEGCKTYWSFVSEMSRTLEKVDVAFRTVAIDISLRSPTTPIFPASPSSTRTKSHSESPIIHTAMKQLIHALEKGVPQGGVSTMLSRTTGYQSSIRNRNYLLSLYEHVKELAFLVAECEATSKETMIIPKNYFTILDDGPIAILGRLMFSKRMPPNRLENVAKNLSLNLTHIIVHSCCPRIPSKHLTLLPCGETSKLSPVLRTKLVHNPGLRNVEEVSLPPETTVRDILTHLVDLMKNIVNDCDGGQVFTSECIETLIQKTEYEDIIKTTHKLKFVDLGLLQTSEDKLCFFGNLENLMSIHRRLHHFTSDNIQADFRLGQDVDMAPIPISDELIQLNTFAYEVGQLGVISLFEVRYVLNRSGLSPPIEWNNVLRHRLFELDKDDPWHTYAPCPDTRLLFVTTSACASSPPVQILSPDKVTEELQTAMTQYLAETIDVDKHDKKVIVPELLIWYRQDFCSELLPENGETDEEEFLQFLCKHLEEEKGKVLQELLLLDRTENTPGVLPFSLEVQQQFNPEFAIAFDYSVIKKTRHSKRPPDSMQISQELPAYHLTPVTLEYLKSNSPLAATLVSLVCSDELDDIEEHFSDDYFAENNRKRAASEISLIDIRSYRYQKLTNDFPAIKHHLLNYVVPIANAEDPNIQNSGDPILKFMTSNITEKVKACLLNLHSSRQFQNVVSDILNELFVDRKWHEIITILDSIPSTVVERNLKLLAWHDFVLCCEIHNLTNEKNIFKSRDIDLASCLCHFKCPVMQTRTVLSVYRNLSVDVALELFEMCYFQNIPTNLQEAVQKKIDMLKIYQKVIDGVKTLQIKLSMQTDEFASLQTKHSLPECHASIDKFTDWRTLLEESVDSPDTVLAVLLKVGDHESIKAWARLHPLTEDKKLEIEERHLIALLDQQPPNTTRTFLLLENLRQIEEEKCLLVCQRLLKTLTNQREVLFIVSYMVHQLAAGLTDDRLDDLRLTQIGAKMLLFLPEYVRDEYSHLVTVPHLLLEQLLMNMNADLAGQAFEKVKNDYVNLRNPARQFSSSMFNDLVAHYASKALEFSVIQSVDKLEEERSQSRASATSDKSEFGEKTQGTPTRVFNRTSTFDKPMSPRSPTPVSATDNSPKRRSSYMGSKGDRPGSLVGGVKFIMPADPPSKDKWVPDSASSVCMICKLEHFSMFNRRHHCRRCGRLVCAGCSSRTIPIHGVSVRTCDDCYRQIFKPSERSDKECNLYEQRPRNSLSQMSATPTTSLSGERKKSMSDVIRHTHFEWKLETDLAYNMVLKDEFYFEQSPSTSLCLSILKHHSDARESAYLMLNFCDDLSNFLKPIAPGVPNPEVDYSLIMSMVKTLLFHAKMKFIKCGENQGMAQCDMYQSRVDLLSMLVKVQYKDLPSIQDLTKVDSVKRLRDQLIKDERLPLAVEVSTKCGLDPSGVWGVWGMTCLQCSDFQGAREKFGRCLRAPMDRNQAQSGSNLLKDVIDTLESMTGGGAAELQALLSGSIKNLLAAPFSAASETPGMDSIQFQECLYYLRTYGSYISIVDFHRRHGYWMKAVQYVIDNTCCTEAYIEGLMMPSLRSGEFAKLLDQMIIVDPTLEKWNPYLTAACRHILKLRKHHILYELQLFMKDYVRAAMTCITCFYQRGAQSYLDFASRSSFLYTAQQHIRDYLDPSKWGSVKRPPTTPTDQVPQWTSGTPETAVRLVQTQAEAQKHIRTIQLQIDITKYLEQCLTHPEADAISLATYYVRKSGGESQTSALPTVFGNSKIRTDLVSMILLSSNDINIAFGLALRIIKEFRLGAVAIFTHVAREMVQHSRHDQVKHLLEQITAVGMGDDETIDEIVGACLLVIADRNTEVKETENLIKMLRNDSNKINAYILCGKLRSAYLMAVKADRVEDVQRIAGAAQRMGQTAVKNICNKWLQQKKH